MTAPDDGSPFDFAPTQRTKVKRLFARGRYDRETVYGILDAGLLCHVGYAIDDHPYVTPTAYWREEDRVYWHGSSASKMLKLQKTGVAVCFTVAHLDGLVMARSGFHHSVNYRSVMAFGQAAPILDADEKQRQLKIFMDRLTPGRWEELRPLTGQELKATTVMSLQLEEVVAKVRSGPPVDDEEDYALPVWAGEVPIHRMLGTPLDDPKLSPDIARPDYLDQVEIE